MITSNCRTTITMAMMPIIRTMVLTMGLRTILMSTTLRPATEGSMVINSA